MEDSYVTIHLIGIQKIVLYPLATAVRHKGLMAEVTFPAYYRKNKALMADAVSAVQYLFGLLAPSGTSIVWGQAGDQYQALYYLAVISEMDEEKPIVIELSNKDWKEGQITKLFTIIRLLADHWNWEIEEKA